MDLMEHTKLLDTVSAISIVVGSPAHTTAKDLMVWTMGNREVRLDWEGKELAICDVTLSDGSRIKEEPMSDRDHWTLLGVASFYDLKVEFGYVDYSRDKDDEH